MAQRPTADGMVKSQLPFVLVRQPCRTRTIAMPLNHSANSPTMMTIVNSAKYQSRSSWKDDVSKGLIRTVVFLGQLL